MPIIYYENAQIRIVYPADPNEDLEALALLVVPAGVPFEIVGSDDPRLIPPPAVYTLPVAVLWLRMTDGEAEDFDAAMSTANPLRLRRAFNSASSMVSDGELFNFAKGVVTSSISAARAAEIMAEPNGATSALAPEEAAS